jgi:hypothetical protein
MMAQGDVLRYGGNALVGDFGRSGAGLALTAPPLLFIDVHPVVGAVLGAMALLFAVFLVRTIERRATAVRVDDDGVSVTGFRTRRIRWADVTGLDLAYYSTRRDRTNGWMQLTLRGPGGRLKVESTLDGFDGLVERAAAAAQARGLVLSETAMENLGALGVAYRPPSADGPPAGSAFTA